MLSRAKLLRKMYHIDILKDTDDFDTVLETSSMASPQAEKQT